MIIKHVFMMLRIKSNFCKIIKVILSIFTTLVLCYSIIGVLYVDYLLKPTFNIIIHEFSLSIILGLCQLNIAYVLFIVICLVKKIICIIRKCDSKNIKPHKRNNCCYKNRLTQILIKVLIIIICVCMIVLDIVTGCYLFIHLTLWGDFNVFAIHCFCITLIYIYSIIMASIIIIKKLHPYVDNKHS